jgi:hypothetical protein
MSDFYQDLEIAINTMLQTDEDLASEVRTFEAGVRECLFTGDKLAQGFRPEELPAINFSAELKPGKSTPFSVGEMQLTIPVQLAIITKAQRGKAAIRQALKIQEMVRVILDRARKSGSALGANTFVAGDVTTSATPIDEKPHSFAVSTIDFTILKVVEI